VIFAVLDVSLAVNLCINCSFFYIYDNNHPITERYGRTDRQTDGRTDIGLVPISISRVSMITRDKKAGSAAEIYALSKSNAVLPYLFGLVGVIWF